MYLQYPLSSLCLKVPWGGQGSVLRWTTCWQSCQCCICRSHLAHTGDQTGLDTIWYDVTFTSSNLVWRSNVYTTACASEEEGNSGEPTLTPGLLSAFKAAESMRRELVKLVMQTCLSCNNVVVVFPIVNRLRPNRSWWKRKRKRKVKRKKPRWMRIPLVIIYIKTAACMYTGCTM